MLKADAAVACLPLLQDEQLIRDLSPLGQRRL